MSDAEGDQSLGSAKTITSVLVAVGLICCAEIAPALAAPSCVTTRKVERVSEDSAGHTLSEAHFFNIRGTLLKIPFGYLNPWPTHLEKIIAGSRNGGKGHEIPGLAFAFWMPTLRYPELDRFSTAWYRPCEQGRTIPQDGQYIVEASITSSWLPLSTSEDQSPKQRFNRRIARKGSDVKLTTEFGLRKATSGPFIVYGTEANADREVSIQCWLEFRELPNPSCLGEFLWRNEMLGLSIRFPQSEISNWSSIANNTRALLYRWRENVGVDQ